MGLWYPKWDPKNSGCLAGTGGGWEGNSGYLNVSSARHDGEPTRKVGECDLCGRATRGTARSIRARAGVRRALVRIPGQGWSLEETKTRRSRVVALPEMTMCMTGILGGSWALSEFRPMEDVPTGVKLTSYAGESSDLTPTQLQDYVSLVESGELKLKLGPNFPFEKLREAHTTMDENRAHGKMVMEVV